MIGELDTVVLTHDVDVHGLKAGDIGAVVHKYKHNATFEVEFVTAEGKTIALLTLGLADIRSMYDTEILHVRELTETAA